MGSKIYKKYEVFGDRLKALRKTKFRTQEAFAEAIGKEVETVRNWEQGRSLPEMETLFRIADMLGCDLDYLSGRLEKKTHDLQFIHDQTGLSEDFILMLQTWKSSESWTRNAPLLVSLIVSDARFFFILQRFNNAMFLKADQQNIMDRFFSGEEMNLVKDMDISVNELEVNEYHISLLFNELIKDAFHSKSGILRRKYQK